MESGGAMRFLNWMKDKQVYIVAGSDKKKVDQQLPASILSRVMGVFCSSANELWDKNTLIYKNNWTPSHNLLTYLSKLYRNSHFTPKGKNFIETRTGMINFSIVGREAVFEQRDIYNKWVNKNKERQNFASQIKSKFPDITLKE